MSDFSGKTVLITGGSLGIGYATAQRFIELGAKVIITGRDNIQLQSAKDKLGEQLMIFESDASDLSAIQRLFDEISKQHIKIDTLFVNAGTAFNTPLGSVTAEDYDLLFDVNVKGAYFTVQKSLPYLSDKASVIFNSSVAGSMGIENLSLYSATKAAILSLTKTLAAELSHKAIRVNAVSPGTTDTPLARKHNQDCMELVEQSIPLEHRLGLASEIADAVVFLAASTSSYITGQNIVVDGGVSSLNMMS